MSNEAKINIEAPETPQPPIRAYTTPPNGILETYSNYINANWGVMDVRIRFGQLTPVSGEAEGSKPPERVVVERVAVTLAWPEVIVLRNILSECIERYEKTNGELKIPTLPK